MPPQHPPSRLSIAGWALLLAAFLGGGLLFWRLGVRDYVIPDNFGVVEPGRVYRSADLTPAATRRVHERYGIRTILDLGAFEPGSKKERAAAMAAEALGVRRYVYRLEGDGSGNPNAYVAALRILADERNHPVLIHCAAGAERTSACVILYRHVFQGRSVEETYPEAFGFRHRPGRNWKLLAYLADWRDQIVEAYRAGGHVPGWEALDERPARDIARSGVAPERAPAAFAEDD